MKIKNLLNFVVSAAILTNISAVRAQDDAPGEKEPVMSEDDLNTPIGFSVKNEETSFEDYDHFEFRSKDKDRLNLFIGNKGDRFVVVYNSGKPNQALALGPIALISPVGMTALKTDLRDQAAREADATAARLEAQAKAAVSFADSLKVAGKSISVATIPETGTLNDFKVSLGAIVNKAAEEAKAAVESSSKDITPSVESALSFKIVDGKVMLVKDGKDIMLFEKYAEATKIAADNKIGIVTFGDQQKAFELVNKQLGEMLRSGKASTADSTNSTSKIDYKSALQGLEDDEHPATNAAPSKVEGANKDLLK